MRIKKSIHKFENNKTFKGIGINVIPSKILEKNFMKDVLEFFNGLFQFFTIQIDTFD